MIMLEKSQIATTIIGKSGDIFFYNKEFKTLCLEKPPENIFSIFKGDDRSTDQLMRLIQTQYAIKNKDSTFTLNGDANPKSIDIKIKKTADAFRLVTTESDARKFFENFEVVTVSASGLMFRN